MDKSTELLHNLITAAEVLLLRYESSEDSEYANFVLTSSELRKQFDAALRKTKAELPKAVVRTRAKRQKTEENSTEA